MDGVAAALKDPRRLAATLAWPDERDALRMYRVWNEADYVPTAQQGDDAAQRREETEVLLGNHTARTPHAVSAFEAAAADSAPAAEQQRSVLSSSFPPQIDESYFRATADRMDTEIDSYTSNLGPITSSTPPSPLPPAAHCIAYDDLFDDEPPPSVIQLQHSPLPRLPLRIAPQPAKPRTDPLPPPPIEVLRSHAMKRPAAVDERKEQLHKRRAAAREAESGGWTGWSGANVGSDGDDDDGGRWRRRGGSSSSGHGGTAGRCTDVWTDGGRTESDEEKEGDSVMRHCKGAAGGRGSGRQMQWNQLSQFAAFQRTSGGWW